MHVLFIYILIEDPFYKYKRSKNLIDQMIIKISNMKEKYQNKTFNVLLKF